MGDVPGVCLYLLDSLQNLRFGAHACCATCPWSETTYYAAIEQLVTVQSTVLFTYCSCSLGSPCSHSCCADFSFELWRVAAKETFCNKILRSNQTWLMCITCVTRLVLLKLLFYLGLFLSGFLRKSFHITQFLPMQESSS